MIPPPPGGLSEDHALKLDIASAMQRYNSEIRRRVHISKEDYLENGTFFAPTVHKEDPWGNIVTGIVEFKTGKKIACRFQLNQAGFYDLIDVYVVNYGNQ